MLFTRRYCFYMKNVGSHSVCENQPTAQLWIQYFNMVTLVKQFIEAEKSGDWQLHLDTIKKMLPFFHASGHFLYAKSCHLYLQDMVELKDKLTDSEYEKFVTSGYFTIRRTNTFRRGIWSDMTIEQTLMKTMHSAGGLTHGRGTSASVLSKWTLSMPTFFDISEQLLQFTDTSVRTSSEQHVDSTDSRSKRDDADVQKFYDWLTLHNPFKNGNNIVCVSTGFKGDETINCYKALDIGLHSMNKVVGSDMKNVKFSRKNRVTSLSALTVSKDNTKNIQSINPTLLFQRISLLIRNDNDLKECLQYEGPYPLTLFDDTGMRKTSKSKLYDYFTPIESPPNFGNSIHVIDGGFLLHRIVWHEKKTYGEILLQYEEYLKKYYNPNSIIIFDGYPDDALSKHTKTAERMRRMQKTSCPDYLFDVTMTPPVSQSKFLSNEKNRKLLITMLMEKLKQANFIVDQAQEDADTLIVHTAIKESKNYDSVIIVGEDVDLLVIFTQIAPPDSNVFFLKPSHGKVEEKLYDCNSFNHPDLKTFIGLIHAFSGCDTTSAFFNQGKGKIIKALGKDRDLQVVCKTFYNEEAFPTYINWAGQKLIQALYGGTLKEECSLNTFRYDCFKKLVSKKNFHLSLLPPSEGAAHQHSCRVFYQLRQWIYNVNDLDVEKWGWKKTPNGLLPITTLQPLVPESVLKTISCKCKKGCTSNCSCKKNGLHCTNLCVNCEGKNCSNIPDMKISLSDDEEDTIDEESNIIDLDIGLDSQQIHIDNEETEEILEDESDNIMFADIDDATDSESEQCSHENKRLRL